MKTIELSFASGVISSKLLNTWCKRARALGVLIFIAGVNAFTPVLAQDKPLGEIIAAPTPTVSNAPPAPIFKCRTASGSLIYQDFPCRGSENMPLPTIIEKPVPSGQATIYSIQKSPSNNAAPTNTEQSRDVPAAPPISSAQSSNPAVALPTFFNCIRYSGEPRITDTPDTTMRLVPESTVDHPETIVQGFVRLEVDPDSPPDAVPADMTWVQDQCRPLSLIETCRHLKGRKDQVRSELARAFQDTRQALEQERDQLDAVLDAYCGAM